MMPATPNEPVTANGDSACELRIRLGWPEFFAAFSVLAVVALVAGAVRAGWEVAVVPGLTYVLAMSGVYLMYRVYARERAQALQASKRAAFRVVDARGVCPLGFRVGDLIEATPLGVVQQLCAPAQHVLRLASASTDGAANERWCCPIEEHALVFQREREQVAA